MKIYKKILMGITLALSAATASYSQTRTVPGSEVAHNAVWEGKIRSRVEFLSDTLCDGRSSGTKGGVEAAAWLGHQFSKIGIIPVGSTYFHKFDNSNGTIGRNLIGMIPTSAQNPSGEYILLAAHFDGMGRIGDNFYPGADSDASGTAALLCVAEMFKMMTALGKTYDKNILLVAIDGKSNSLRGADRLWELIAMGRLNDPVTGVRITSQNVKLMVNIDQIGATMSPLKSDREDYMIMLGDTSGPGNYKDALLYCNDRYGIGLDLAFDYYGSKDFTRLFYERISDQRIFVRNSKPAVMFTSGITMNNNKIWDTAETLDYKVLKKRIWLIFHWIERIIS